ncbi:MAG: Na+/H+ antiporter NhaC family protein, partial [Gemmatimonadota bacterium]|nr:Na+/H+ antiporter NhaC family protein [Gemmatimonadota bacterium]
MRRSALLTAIFFLCLGTTGLAAQEVDGPTVFLKGVPFSVTVSGVAEGTPVSVMLAGGEVVSDTIAGMGDLVLTGLVVESASDVPISVRAGAETSELVSPVLPGLISILPPLFAIVLALVFREVVTSLIAGIWLGCIFLAGYNPITALFMVGNDFARTELADPDNAAVILFSMMLGGMVGIITRMGGTRAIVDAVSPIATTRIRAQLATWLAGLAIFFDDYSNTLIVGNTMRPLTDKLKISREKLAYIVDSTAAPVAAVFFVSTWIGYEVGLIDDGLELAAQQHAGNPSLVAELMSASGFGIFLETIPYLFYPILAIVMVVMVAATGRDFGPMLKAERRAASGGGLIGDGAQVAADMDTSLTEAESVPPGRWFNGAIPVAVLVVTVLAGLISTGLDSLGPDWE